MKQRSGVRGIKVRAMVRSLSLLTLLLMVGMAALTRADAQTRVQQTREQQTRAQQPQSALHVDSTGVDVLTGTLQRVAATGRVRLTYRADVLPFSFVPESWQRPVGYSIAICTEVVNALSVHLGRPLRIEWVPVNAANRFEAILEAQADLECGTSSDTPQRRQQLSFSTPIFATGTRMLVRRDSPLHTLRDITGQRVGMVAGTSARQAWADWLEQQNGPMVEPQFADYREGLLALQAGQVDALLGDEVLLYAALTQMDARRNYRFIGPWVSYEVYGIAFEKTGNRELKTWLDALLARMAASGQLHTLYTRWFERRLPGGSTLPDGENLRLPMNPVMQSMLAMLAQSAQTPPALPDRSGGQENALTP